MKNSLLAPGRRVRVYRNLHTGNFSVQCTKTGLVIAHTSHISLEKASFVVRKRGRERVLLEKKKNVHAFVVGVVTYTGARPSSLVRYNPYASDFFFAESTGKRVDQAELVMLTDNKIFI